MNFINVFVDYGKKHLSCLNTCKSAEMNQISVKILKEAANILAYPLAKIVSFQRNVKLLN